MEAKRTIFWTIVALVVGIGLGFGFRAPIASTLNLEAQQVISPPVFWLPEFDVLKQYDPNHGCTPPKYWTGNGCADTSKWTVGDWYFFSMCVNALDPKSSAGVISCVQQTEKGHPR